MDDMKNCEARAKIIDEMHLEDVAEILPLLEHISGLRETLEILEEDPSAAEAIKEADREIAAGKVTAFEER